MVIDRNAYPSILIECGFLNNPKDLAFITDPSGQEKIARKILEGIVKYSNAQAVNITDEKQAGTENTSITRIPLKASELGTLDVTPSDSDDKMNKQEGGSKKSNQIYTKVEVEPDYPSGPTGWVKYLTQHLKYPDAAVKKKIEGTVLMQFIVNTDGKISDVKVISGPEELRASSIKVIKERGNWISASEKGKKVKCYKKQPITYKLA